MLTNDLSKLKEGGAQYTVMCYENGGTVDDLLVYKYSDQHYLLVVNASNIEKDFDWLQSHLGQGVELTNISAETAQLALQGPLAERVLQKLSETDLSSIGFLNSNVMSAFRVSMRSYRARAIQAKTDLKFIVLLKRRSSFGI